VHDLHAWTITSGMPALTAHVVVEDEYLADCADVLDKVSACLAEHFDLEHTTLQLEPVGHLEHEPAPGCCGLLGEQADPGEEQREDFHRVRADVYPMHLGTLFADVAGEHGVGAFVEFRKDHAELRDEHERSDDEIAVPTLPAPGEHR